MSRRKLSPEVVIARRLERLTLAVIRIADELEAFRRMQQKRVFDHGVKEIPRTELDDVDELLAEPQHAVEAEP